MHLVYLADAYAAIQDAPVDTFDVTITDPPYTPHVHANHISGTTIRKWVNGEIVSSGIPKKDLAFAPLQSYAWVSTLLQCTRRHVLLFCALEDFAKYKDAVSTPCECGGRPKCSVCHGTGVDARQYVRSSIWYKPNAQGQLTGDRPANACEGIAWLHRPGQKHWNGHGSYGFWVCNSTRGKKDRHDNEKPLKLALKLVALASDRGETVFDPFCGSGTIGEACWHLGRHYIGLDNDPKWVDRARERLDIASRVLPFGDMPDENALKLCSAKKEEICESI